MTRVESIAGPALERRAKSISSMCAPPSVRHSAQAKRAGLIAGISRITRPWRSKANCGHSFFTKLLAVGVPSTSKWASAEV